MQKGNNTKQQQQHQTEQRKQNKNEKKMRIGAKFIVYWRPNKTLQLYTPIYTICMNV